MKKTLKNLKVGLVEEDIKRKEVKTVNYNNKSTGYDIIESDMEDIDKDKIDGWIGRSR